MESKQRMLAVLSCSALALLLQGCNRNNIQDEQIAANTNQPQAVATQVAANNTQTSTTTIEATAKLNQADALKLAKQQFIERKYEQALQTLEPLAQAGNADAQYGLGYLYYYGKGIEAEQDKGIKWISAAAEQGFPNAVRAMEILQIDLPEQHHLAQHVDNPQQHATKVMNKQLAKKQTKKAQIAQASTQQRKVISRGSSTNRAQTIAANDNAMIQPILKSIRNSDKNVVQQKAPDVRRLSSNSTYGPTTSLDTMWSIAKTTRPNQRVSIYKMMDAIYKSNPDAFNGPDVASLKENVTLRIPSMQEIQALEAQG